MILAPLKEVSSQEELQGAVRDGWSELRLLLRALLGKPTEAKTSNYSADWGDMVVFDASASPVIGLPGIDAQRIGSVLLLASSSDDFGGITLQPASGQTVNSLDAYVRAVVRPHAIIVAVVVSRAGWIAVEA